MGKEEEEGDINQRKREEQEQSYEEFITRKYRCSITGKDRNVVWRNFDTTSAKIGINRELIRTLVKENEEEKIHMEELIDPTLVIFSNTTKEKPQMDVLNNVKNSVVDSFHTTK